MECVNGFAYPSLCFFLFLKTQGYITKNKGREISWGNRSLQRGEYGYCWQDF